ncbi:hypothetical protein XM53_16470 [Roseovarius atlanticus]|uniref:Uncharacterized protein n=1 Tax=Roseovarius atlanticus TaxID=1641875 RepID=A0A0T5NRF1_9RHOB|nr:hypothetical protein XM53_16470 [Roseovarius atlanticus]
MGYALRIDIHPRQGKRFILRTRCSRERNDAIDRRMVSTIGISPIRYKSLVSFSFSFIDLSLDDSLQARRQHGIRLLVVFDCARLDKRTWELSFYNFVRLL